METDILMSFNIKYNRWLRKVQSAWRIITGNTACYNMSNLNFTRNLQIGDLT